MKSLATAALFVSIFLLQELCPSAKFLTKSVPFQSRKAPAETVKNYQIVSPVVSFTSDDPSTEVHPSELIISVDDKVVHLELNRGLLPAHFTSRYYDENNNEIIEKGHVNCFYQGWVENYPDWKVTISTCQGLQGSFGDLGNGEQYYHIEPIDPHPISLEVPHALYLATEYNITRGSCGAKHNHSGGEDVSSHIGIPDMELAKTRLRRQTDNGFLIVEWAVVNDNRQYQRFGENLTATVLRSLEIANFVDSLYQDLNIRVVLVDVTTWTNGDQINVVPDPETLLDNFALYKRQITARFDSAMLITNIDLTGNTVGIAFIGTMCGISSVGLSQDRRSGVDAVGSTAAHELGHIFNMQHDDGQRSCICNDPSGDCIMASVSGFPSPTQFSDCSRSDLQVGFNSRNLDRCLFNEPSVTIGDPVCGNGIRERDEICDCGSPEECQNPCCNATTCMLADGADCGEGQCCENCQFKAYGTTCREAERECDVIEYCSRDSPDCPTNLQLQDGTSCSNNQSYCFTGVCRSHDQQCQFHWGPGSSMAVQQCYDEYNVRGEGAGNCGYSGAAFVACAAEDVLCGQLQCDSGSYQRQVNIGVFLWTGTVTVNRERQDCLSFSPMSPPTDFLHPGLVEDGTKCGDERLCFMRQCVAISSLTSIQPCPVGTNGETCSGKGVCNNLNQCSCSVGFNGDACQSIFNGPGSEQLSTNNAGVIAGAVIGTLLGLALLAGVIIGIVVLVFVMKPRKKYKYTPPKQSNGTSSSPRTTSYKRAGGGSSANSSPSVNVVRPGKHNVGHHVFGASTPSAPPRSVATSSNSVGNIRPPPPKPVSRPPPPKPLSHAPPPQTKPRYNPPAVKPAAATRYPASSSSVAKPPPPVLAQKPQVAMRQTKVQGRWPPSSVDSHPPPKPTPPPKKPIIPPH